MFSHWIIRSKSCQIDIDPRMLIRLILTVLMARWCFMSKLDLHSIGTTLESWNKFVLLKYSTLHSYTHRGTEPFTPTQTF